jgi:ElaB/YqjD/DUF883 family membrane-anchored ribosome-binding protein
MAEEIVNVEIKASIDNIESVFSQTTTLADKEPVEIIANTKRLIKNYLILLNCG